MLINKWYTLPVNLNNEIAWAGRSAILELLIHYFTFCLFMDDRMVYRETQTSWLGTPPFIEAGKGVVSFSELWAVMESRMVWENRVVDNMRFTKRISKLFRGITKYKLPSHILSEVGNLADVHSVVGFNAEVMLSHDLGWHAGHWKDEGSCYWSEYIDARPTILASGGGAVLVRDATTKERLGRVWYIPNFAGSDMWALFNSTVEVGGICITQKRMGILLAPLLGLRDVKHVDTMHSPGFAPSLYINNGLTMVYGDDDVDKYEPHDHKWVVGYMYDSEVYCMCCGERIRNVPDLWRDGYGEEVCPECWDMYYVYCSDCTSGYHERHMVWSGDERLAYCPDCNPGTCDECGHAHKQLEHTDEGSFCPGCYAGLYSPCDTCGKKRYIFKKCCVEITIPKE